MDQSDNQPLPLPGVSLSAKARRTQEAPITALISAAMANPDLISFAAGLVDPLTLPVEECLGITRKIFSDRTRGQTTLQYETTMGLKPLREALLKHVQNLEGGNPWGEHLTANDVVITTGSQQTLYLVGDVLLDPGDIVIAANPSYFVFAGTLQSLGAKVLTVPMDDEGMIVDEVEDLLEQLAADGSLPRVKFIYCTSFFDNPTGLTLSVERRSKLLAIVQKFSRSHRILILEDAAYRELRYDGDALPSIKSFDIRNQFVILTQTFSKPFAPGIKLGYTLCPKGLLEPILHQKGNHDFGSANLSQQIALETMRDGSYLKHLDVLKSAYQRKRDAMLDALARHMPSDPGVHWTHPHGGLYVWLSLPSSIDTGRGQAMFAECVNHGVLYVPGEYCFQPDPAGHIPRHHMRLSYGQVAIEKIDEGVERLADVVKRQLASRTLPRGHEAPRQGAVA